MNHYGLDPGREPRIGVEDDGISPYPTRLDDDPIQTLYKENAIPPLWIGIGSIMLGIVVLSRILLPEVWYWLLQETTSSILLALVMIGFGVWQIGKHVGKK
ncbi:hypothetical protein [Paenibacillus sp. N3.4]|uniref:hypothetical protein n=1 Tax=Paenibacillus sp. N3.4 TaxID=2603222 RepID=UPI0011C7D2D0|nr:hypothetical protein [Paenibacillus sp. N3.4]TXK83456.1 hypothetical protein FU659_13790 [Paenibacillus sp. N3.4]